MLLPRSFTAFALVGAALLQGSTAMAQSAIAQARTPAQISAASQALGTPDASSLASALAANPNVYVHAVQTYLEAEGIRDTPATGRLDSATVRQLLQFCDMNEIGAICRRGPLLPETASAIGALMAGTTATAEAPAPTPPAEPATAEAAPAEAPAADTATPAASSEPAAAAPQAAAPAAATSSDATWLDGAQVGTLGSGGALPEGWTATSLTDVEVLAVDAAAAEPSIDLKFAFSNNGDARSYPRIEAAPVPAQPGTHWQASVTYRLLDGTLDQAPGAFLNVEERGAERRYLTANRPADLNESVRVDLPFTTSNQDGLELVLRVIMLTLEPGQSGTATLRIADPQLSPAP